ncbi:response regulator transcription factor [Kerstersia gyiorum]|uniref:DNA-binding response OmpR family regulator n=1 Tax=Kerstersia gyiorum TaxID=206506 RepID=A0A4Q7MSX9_9BURK|nr:response regulator transcription factor [Kerstersia gyiorum]MCO7642238.1 response regulator transcription factor [Pseudomonas sp. S 311-6]KAB0543622.1 response regulator transcription factor [Kerstersia gyiorum]MCP1634093.1 DNA-binding response OmpR family regulator [Kerstersia gyiorum]MCP1637748.1 DNA-binding response OmpR family regulator [Kerstersia gyiorum]MCP1670545.1 DNA-binding response OmpR family regulator [Kerstersia gyiorum]
MREPHIAVLEDDPSQGAQMQQTLLQAGFRCTLFRDGSSMLAAVRSQSFDLLILDWNLPNMDGEEVLKKIRSRHGVALPIIFVTSRTDENDLARGLQSGADDYITKPWRKVELLARIRALLRRVYPEEPEQGLLTFGRYTIDTGSRTISLDGTPAVLTPKEYELALLFFRQADQLLSRAMLADAVWNREIPPTSRTLDTHLSNIRQKLQLRPENGVRLTSSYALGYRLEIITES